MCAQGVKNISVQSSVSLQHLPYNKDLEQELPAGIVDRLAFAKQKLDEIVPAAKAEHGGKSVALTSALPTVGAPFASVSYLMIMTLTKLKR